MQQAPANHKSNLPWASLKSATAGPQAFKRMIESMDSKAQPGNLVAVYDKAGQGYGVAFYNPRSVITLRMIYRGDPIQFKAEDFFSERVEAAVNFRRKELDLDKSSDAYRLIYDYGDGLPGLVVDRYGDCIVSELYTLGMYKHIGMIEEIMKKHFPTARFVRRATDYSENMEGFAVPNVDPFTVRIKENGVIFEVHPHAGSKTGFFCDQRENRLEAAKMASGKSVLDVCSYTGGFGIYAKKIGGAKEVSCIELNPENCEWAKRNANINGARVDIVAVDAFTYLRQMASLKRRFGMIILDPYKLINSRETYIEGKHKYSDLNRLAFTLLEPGGILVTCSCSGMLPWEEFQHIVRNAAAGAGRRAQIIRKSGAGADHPIATDYPEAEYLKVIWTRAF